MLFNQEETLTVSQLNNWIKGVVNEGFPEAVWVCGEIQGYDRNKLKTHIFFELCEKDDVSKNVNAKIGLVIFARTKSYINTVLKKSADAFNLKDDIEVKFLCKVDFYAPHGAMRLIVEDIDPVYTLGKIAQDRAKLIAELKKKGVLEKNKSLVLSEVPLNIGLVTAYDSAAYNDFLDELKSSGFGFKVFFVKALMQGNKTEMEVCRAITRLNKMKAVDAIVITRGGGSIADLSCFDSKKIAEKIAASTIPVLTGIGHEINMSVTDMAAHTFAKTPTAIAQFIVERVQFFLDEIQQQVENIVARSQEIILSEKEKLRFDAVALQNKTTHFLKKHNETITRYQEAIKRQPFVLLNNKKADVKYKRADFIKTIQSVIQGEKQKVNHVQKIIDIAHPANTLKRGFSITRDVDGKVVKAVEQVAKDDVIATEVFDGMLKSKVDLVKKK